MTIEKILVADDSLTQRRHLELVMRDAGYDVITADNAHSALATAVAEQPDLIFLDVVMPGLDGFAVCRNLSAHPQTTHIPVVLISSKNDARNRVKAVMAGARTYLTKPDLAQELLSCIREIAATGAPRQ